MSFPNIPNMSSSINIEVEESVNLLLASIAFEELGLAHIINAEAEKIQFVLGTLAGQTTLVPPTVGALISINRSIKSILKTVIKQQMLLQFKLEDVLDISTSFAATDSKTTITTATTATAANSEPITAPTTTFSPLCAPALRFAVFANNNLNVARSVVIDANTQVNGNMTVANNGNTFLGNTTVVGMFTDSSNNSYQNLVVNGNPIPFRNFDPLCLQQIADTVINGDLTIDGQETADRFKDQTVWVNGNISITGDNIKMIGGGIMASGEIKVTGANFTYTSTRCFALYSQLAGISITNSYNITGLVYTATAHGNIQLEGNQGGTLCGAVISGGNVFLGGQIGVHEITNMG